MKFFIHKNHLIILVILKPCDNSKEHPGLVVYLRYNCNGLTALSSTRDRDQNGHEIPRESSPLLLPHPPSPHHLRQIGNCHRAPSIDFNFYHNRSDVTVPFHFVSVQLVRFDDGAGL